MSVATQEAPEAPEARSAGVRSDEAPTSAPPPRRRPWRLPAALGVIVVWTVLAIVFQGKRTLEIGGADQIGVQNWFGDRAFDIAVNGDDYWFVSVTHGIADVLDAIVHWLQPLLSTPAFPSPYPHIGFVGVLAIAWFLTAWAAGWRMSLLTVAAFVSFAVLGYYEDSMDLLIVTGLSVGIAVAVGLPVAIWMAHSARARAVATPVLDVMQTLPSFAYLLPLMLLFKIGPAAAVVCTLIYSLPPVIRIAGHGLQHLPATTMEAAESLGLTKWQRLFKVELPLAKRTVIVGINQTTMAALSMATIAAFINGPGLGQPVVRALNALRTGDAAVAGGCIVIMAIMLDRVQGLAIGAVVTVIAVYLSRTFDLFAKPWDTDLGTWLAGVIQDATDWVQLHWVGATTAISDAVTNGVLNHLQYVIAGAPWFVTGLAILAIAVIVGGWRAGVATLVCLIGLRWLELWNNAMITLTTTLLAAAVVMLLAVTVGVWMGRSKRADSFIRPVLDAGQTLPPFVYLIPVLALFGATRFTAILAAVAYAAPAAIKIVADGIKAVSATTLEAAESAGAIAIQIITKVQIPMARASFTVATNQGLLYVLAMVVIGGLVGAGALGYDVVAGFKQQPIQGRGLAAGFSIVLLGIMLDRITTYAARRVGRKAAK